MEDRLSRMTTLSVTNAAVMNAMVDLKSLAMEGASDLGSQPCRREVVGAKKCSKAAVGTQQTK